MISNCVNYVNVHGHAYVGGIVGGVARSDEMIVYMQNLVKLMNMSEAEKLKLLR